MNYTLDHNTGKTARVQRLFAGTLALACAFAAVTHAQNLTTPTTPPIITRTVLA
jgi:hypothetical protein